MKISNKLFTKLEELLDQQPMCSYTEEASDITRVMLNSLMILKSQKRYTDKELNDAIKLLYDLIIHHGD